MGMHNPMPLGSYGFPAVSSSSDILEGCTDGVCPVHVLKMVFLLDLTVGSSSSSSLTVSSS